LEIGESTLPLCVQAVQCTMLQNHYGTITECYRAIAEHCEALTEALRSVTVPFMGRYGSVTEPLRNAAKHYRTLWSIEGRYRTLQNITEALRKHYRSIAEALQKRYTPFVEPLQKISILLILS